MLEPGAVVGQGGRTIVIPRVELGKPGDEYPDSADELPSNPEINVVVPRRLGSEGAVLDRIRTADLAKR